MVGRLSRLDEGDRRTELGEHLRNFLCQCYHPPSCSSIVDGKGLRQMIRVLGITDLILRGLSSLAPDSMEFRNAQGKMN